MEERINHSQLGAIVGLIDPEIREKAEILVEKLEKHVSERSFLRSKFSERFFGSAKGFIEGHAQGKSPIVSVILEKLSDLLDFAGANFFHGNGQSASRIANEWLEQFLADASEKIELAKTRDELDTELKRFEMELKVRERIVEIVEHSSQTKRSEDSVAKPLNPDSLIRGATGVMGSLTRFVNEKREEREG